MLRKRFLCGMVAAAKNRFEALISYIALPLPKISRICSLVSAQPISLL
jgi:hypothetical protein